MNIEDPEVHMLRNKHHPQNGTGLSLDPEYLVTGSNSGYQALNLAVLTAPDPVILIGYDAREPEPGKPSHWFGEHPRVAPVGAFLKYRQSFKLGAKAIASAGIRVLNCSPGSAIDVFPKISLEEAFGNF